MPPKSNKSINVETANVVAPIADAETFGRLETIDLATICDVVEFRIDALLDLGDTVRTALEQTPLPKIVTVRSPQEGGMGNLDSASRAAHYLSALEDAAMIDIEITSIPDLAEVMESARNNEVPVLGSFHDFEYTPTNEELRQRMDTGMNLGVDAIKIATRLESEDDLERLLSLLQADVPLPLSVMGMGSLGRKSRKLAANRGSFLNYGYLFEPNAPGQISAKELKEFLTGASSA